MILRNNLMMGMVGGETREALFSLPALGEYCPIEGGYFGGLTRGGDSELDSRIIHAVYWSEPIPGLFNQAQGIAYCQSHRGGGHNDWELPTIGTLQAAGYVSLKPTTAHNDTSHGVNSIEFPVGRTDNYSTTYPKQTRSVQFKSNNGSGVEFIESWYWTRSNAQALYMDNGRVLDANPTETYYIRACRRVNLSEKIRIGDYYKSEKGYLGGFLNYEDQTIYAIFWADKVYETSLPFKTSATASPYSPSGHNGLLNTLALTATQELKDEHPAAAYCVDLRAGGKSDWYLPSKEELNVIGYIPLGSRSLSTSNLATRVLTTVSFPTTYGLYSRNWPPRTHSINFKEGGDQAFLHTPYLSSGSSDNFNVWAVSFANGADARPSKTLDGMVRPMRRVRIN